MSPPPAKSAEQPLMVERFVSLFHLPYLLGSLLIGALIGPPFQFLALYLDTFNVGRAVELILASTPAQHSAPMLQNLANAIAFFLLPIYFLYGIRYMRLKLVATEPKLQLLSTDREETVRDLFGSVSRKVPIMIIGALSFLASIDYVSSLLEVFNGSFYLIYIAVSNVLFFFVGASFIWVFFASVMALRKIGKKPLRLKPFYEDSMLGTRPIGALSLYLAAVYFAGVGLAAILIVTSLATTNLLLYTLLMFTLVAPGVLMFFLPLLSVHRQMVIEKQREQSFVRDKSAKLFEGLRNPVMTFDPKELTLLEILERKVLAIHTWPVDAQIMGRLTTIVVSVVTIMIARFVQIALHL